MGKFFSQPLIFEDDWFAAPWALIIQSLGNKKRDKFKNWQIVKVHIFSGENDLLKKWLFPPSFMRIGQKMWIFTNGQFLNMSHFFTQTLFCWSNCLGNSQEQCFKCNLIYSKLPRFQGITINKFLKLR